MKDKNWQHKRSLKAAKTRKAKDPDSFSKMAVVRWRKPEPEELHKSINNYESLESEPK